MVLFRSSICAALLGIFSASAFAQTIVVDTLVSSSTNPVQNWSGLFKVGQSFTANTSGNVKSLTLNLTTTNSTTTPVYAIELWSTNGQATPLPSALLATFVSGQRWNTVYSATQNPASTVTFADSSLTGNYSLVSGTTYWLVVSTTSGAAKGWGVGTTDVGDSAQYSSTTSTWSALNLTGSLGMQITALSAVPEPGTYALIGGAAALGFSVFVRRRRQSRALR